MRRRGYALVVAATAENGIGKNGRLPWSLPAELAQFRRRTCGLLYPESTEMMVGKPEGSRTRKVNAVIMGRKTWQSIPLRNRPLKDRINVVLTRAPEVWQRVIEEEMAEAATAAAAEAVGQDTKDAAEDEGVDDDNDALPSVLVTSSMHDAIRLLEGSDIGERLGHIFVIGGEHVFREAMLSDRCERIYLTAVESEAECDTFLPPIEEDTFAVETLSEPVEEGGMKYRYVTYVRRSVLEQAEADELLRRAQEQEAEERSIHEEEQYLSAVRDILENGVERDDRTGVGTISKFGVQMRFNLRNDVFPLLTTKRVFWRGIAEELLWFIRADTNAKHLQDRDIHIWDGNASREFLDARGLPEREEGDLGPVYGFQWRHFGATYVDMHTDYTGQGVDQLMNCINTIKENPMDRRILMSAWNPADLDQMALPPCHMFCQFYVANGELSCQMYQRAGDMGLGVPFNIASYALLTRLVAQVCGLQPGEFVHVIGDAHVYKNHVEPLREELLREPRPFPTLHINPEKDDIDSFEFNDFTLNNYHPHGPIKMPVAV